MQINTFYTFIYTFCAEKHIFQHNGIMPVAWYETVVVYLPACSYPRHLAHLAVEVFDGTRSVFTHHQASDAFVEGVASAVVVLHVVFRMVRIVGTRQTVVVGIGNHLTFLRHVHCLVLKDVNNPGVWACLCIFAHYGELLLLLEESFPFLIDRCTFVSLFFRGAFPFVLLIDRTRMLTSIQLYSMLVQYAEHRTSTTEAAGFPDFFNRVSSCIEVNDCLLSIHASFLGSGNWRELNNHSFLKF